MSRCNDLNLQNNQAHPELTLEVIWLHHRNNHYAYY